MSEGIDALVRMANQIASNVAHHRHDQAVAEVATHLRSFWAPSMREDLAAWVDAGGTGLDPVAYDAVAQLRVQPHR